MVNWGWTYSREQVEPFYLHAGKSPLQYPMYNCTRPQTPSCKWKPLLYDFWRGLWFQRLRWEYDTLSMCWEYQILSPCWEQCSADSMILSAPPTESMILSAHADSIILSVLPIDSMIPSACAESIILSVHHAESMILLAPATQTWLLNPFLPHGAFMGNFDFSHIHLPQ